MNALILVSLAVVFLGGKAEAAFLQVKGAFHVHTTVSTGSRSLEEVIEEARREGIGALILTENFLLRFEYGLFPLQALVKKVVEKPSVLRLGNGQWLRSVEAAQVRFPDVVLIPGVEVIPYYYWTGSPLRRDLTLWDVQKNLLVVGLSRPEHYAQIPAIGNGRRFPPGPIRLFKLSLAAVAIGGGILLLRTRREREVRLKRFTLKVQKRYRLPGWSALGIGVLILLEAFLSSELNPYRGNLGIEPYQPVIEYAESRGGAVFWSFPEARDFGHIGMGRLGEALVRTDPHPGVLLQSDGFTGFGAVYQDNVTFTEPGREWDQLLLEYTQGRRARPAWGIGELGYHGPPKRLGDVLTIFLVPERSREAILSALKEGRLYAVQPLRDYSLVLEEFFIGQEGRTGWAPMGGELDADGRGALLIRFRVSASNGQEAPFTLRLIHSGKVLTVLEGTTPFERIVRATPPEAGRREYFRIEIKKPHRLLSNPIFVRRR